MSNYVLGVVSKLCSPLNPFHQVLHGIMNCGAMGWRRCVEGRGWWWWGGGVVIRCKFGGVGSHSRECPAMSLCGFDKDRDLCSFKQLWAGIIVAMSAQTCCRLRLNKIGKEGGADIGNDTGASLICHRHTVICLKREREKQLPHGGRDVTATQRNPPGSLRWIAFIS